MIKRLLAAPAAIVFIVFSVVLGIAVGLASQNSIVVRATDPCDEVTITSEPSCCNVLLDPMVYGNLQYSGAGAVEGATVYLFGCTEWGPSLLSSDSTDNKGDFEFDGVADDAYYFVYVQPGQSQNEPLYGYVPTAETDNPSVTFYMDPLGPVQIGVDTMTFEED